MRATLRLAAALLLTGATAARAQISDPSNLVAPLPHAPTRHLSAKPEDDAQWLWTYAQPAPGGRAADLRLDARFQSLIETFHQPQALWGDAQHPAPLAAVIPLFLSQYGSVTAEYNRYLAIDGCVPSFCPAAGLLWIDLGSPRPLMVFAATNWSTEGHTTGEAAADYNLWLFPNRQLNPNALPFALTQAIAHWNVRLAMAHRLVPHVAQALLVEPDGTPTALDPQLAGANTLAPQPDTLTPHTDQ
jgi:hypothetical protein